MVDDTSHEGLRVLLREEGVSFQRVKTWKASKDPDYAAKKAQVEHLYAIADREVVPEAGEPEVIFCVDEFGDRRPRRPSRQPGCRPYRLAAAVATTRGYRPDPGAEGDDAWLPGDCVVGHGPTYACHAGLPSR